LRLPLVSSKMIYGNCTQPFTICNLYIKIADKKTGYFSYLFDFFNIIVSLSGYPQLFGLDINNDQDRIWDIATTPPKNIYIITKMNFTCTHTQIYIYIYREREREREREDIANLLLVL